MISNKQIINLTQKIGGFEKNMTIKLIIGNAAQFEVCFVDKTRKKN